ncbi:helix-turn-helix domain-containing protein [Salmonella enterica]|nr:helix-turn-helix domain-containing protein [Salmonella enterica]EMD3058123.1 helix-turn-helix domain-containing protein [Salmonella enterica]EMD3062720.1 helix-turn-helix domain-containing protein [Salmonella enterica]EMD3094572.1 helix-turn-helix domain-containing protein [Salmonella enterica]EMD3454723.1 helix-turn-helix domain-containing protein [Salmonella enterica]
MNYSALNRIKRFRELEIIGALIGNTEDELSENIKAWIVEKISQIKLEYGVLDRASLPTQPTGYIPYNIGNRIQIARENLGMSHDNLAEKLDIHPGYVLTWEDGTDQPLAGMIIPLANALRCDPMWLLTGKSHHEPVAHTVMPSSPVEVMQNVDVSTIGKRIGVARVANHMNTQELEEAIGAPDGTVFRWETGKAIPSSQYIDILARTLNVSVTWLSTGKEITKES